MATTKNVEWKKYNGTDYDTLYPKASGNNIVNTVPVKNGGTGADSAQQARANLGIAYSNMGVNPVATGGTGKSNLDAGKVLVGKGTSAVEMRSVIDNTTPQTIPSTNSMVTGRSVSNWTGSGNINTVGTVQSGTWQGDAVDVAHGGTGATTPSEALNNLGAFPKSGGTFTGGIEVSGGVAMTGSLWVQSRVTMKDILILEAPSFGNVLPSTGTAGQIFFKRA